MPIMGHPLLQHLGFELNKDSCKSRLSPWQKLIVSEN